MFHSLYLKKGNRKNVQTVDRRKNLRKGVSERINRLVQIPKITDYRPPYIHQVPLDFLPGFLGRKHWKKLIERFGTEMAIIHEAPLHELLEVIPRKDSNNDFKSKRG